MTNETNSKRSPKEIYFAAIEISGDGERQRYLDSACAGDAALRASVAEMLSLRQSRDPNPLDGIVGDLGLDATTDHSVATNQLPSEWAGEIDIAAHPLIGNYKLLEQLGEGGMGTVYMAQQTKPVRRRVALKLIKSGMNSKDVVARFEAERQALAMMDHQNIARVLDGGTSEKGRPYFVMELVRGVPIDKYADQQSLTVRERLALFIDVCKAVQHAHQKGIIHRDLKPSNVMVTINDGEAVVKVIDFGVAKALNQELTDKTLFTQFSQMIGTPLYMSPEQTLMSSLDIDTRSDIYSLGVMLYQLLTGSTPFDKDDLSRAGFDGMRRIIQEDEPPRPSQRVSTLAAEGHSTETMRRLGRPQELVSSIRGELDWIVMKAIEKDRNRRYESAGGLARDINRYLNDEPVEANPQTVIYRLQKYGQRHRAFVGTMVSVMLLMLCAIAGTSWQAFRATKAETESAGRLATILLEQGKTEEALGIAKTAEAEQRRLRGEAEASQREAKWNLYVAKLVPIRLALENREFGRLSTLLDETTPGEGEPDFRGWEWYYCRDTLDENFLRLTNEGKNVTGLARWSPVDSRFATTGEKSIDIWDSASMKMLHRIECKVRPRIMRWSPSARMIAVGDHNGDVSVVNVKSGTVVWEGNPLDGLSVHEPTQRMEIYGLCWSPDEERIGIANRGSDISLLNLRTGEKTILTRWGEHSKLCGGLDWSPDGKQVAAYEQFGVRSIYDLESGLRNTLATESVEVSGAIKWSPSGSRLAISEEDIVRIVNREGGTVQRLQGHLGFVNALEWIGNDTIVSGSDDRTVRKWNVETGEAEIVLSVADKRVTDVSVDASGVRVMIKSGGVFLAKLANPKLVSLANTPDQFDAADDSVPHSTNALCWNSDGTRIAELSVVQVPGTLKSECGIWTIPVPRSLARHAVPYSSGLEWTPDERFAIRFSAENDLMVVEPHSGLGFQSSPKTHAHRSAAGFSVSPDTRIIAIEQESLVVKFIDRFSGNEKATFRDDKMPKVYSIVWNHASTQALAFRYGKTAVLNVDGSFDISRSKLLNAGRSASWHPNDQLVAVGCQSGFVILAHPHDLSIIMTLRGHGAEVVGVAFSPSGHRLASGSNDGTVRIWDVATGQELLQLRVNGIKGFEELAWSPDGLQLAASCSSRTIAVWGSNRLQSTPESASYFEGGQVVTGMQSVSSDPIELTKRIPLHSWREPYSEIELMMDGHDRPIDADSLATALRRVIQNYKVGGLLNPGFATACRVAIDARSDPDEAILLARASANVLSQRMIDQPSMSSHVALCETYLAGARRLVDSQKLREALQMYDAAYRQAEKVVEVEPSSNSAWRRLLSVHLQQIGAAKTAILDFHSKEDVDANDQIFVRSYLTDLCDHAEELADRIPSDAWIFEVDHRTKHMKPAWVMSTIESITIEELDRDFPLSFPEEWKERLALTTKQSPGRRLYYDLYRLALLHLKTDDHAKYQKVCRRMLDQFGESDDRLELDLTVWTCCLQPDATSDYGPFIQLAEKNIRLNSDDTSVSESLGAIQMRAGLLDEALDSLRAANINANSRAYTKYFLAMTHYHLGHEAQSREELNAANVLAEQQLVDTPRWNGRMTLELLRAEAEQLVLK